MNGMSPDAFLHTVAQALPILAGNFVPEANLVACLLCLSKHRHPHKFNSTEIPYYRFRIIIISRWGSDPT